MFVNTESNRKGDFLLMLIAYNIEKQCQIFFYINAFYSAGRGNVQKESCARNALFRRYKLIHCIRNVISLHFNIYLPLKGNTPYLSLPIAARPDMAMVFAESPSVNMSVQSRDLFVPASLASSNFGMPKIHNCVKYRTYFARNTT